MFTNYIIRQLTFNNQRVDTITGWTYLENNIKLEIQNQIAVMRKRTCQNWAAFEKLEKSIWSLHIPVMVYITKYMNIIDKSAKKHRGWWGTVSQKPDSHKENETVTYEIIQKSQTLKKGYDK